MKYRPGEDVRNLFAKKQPQPGEPHPEVKARSPPKQRKKLFEYEGRYDDIDMEDGKAAQKR